MSYSHRLSGGAFGGQFGGPQQFHGQNGQFARGSPAPRPVQQGQRPQQTFQQQPQQMRSIRSLSSGYGPQVGAHQFVQRQPMQAFGGFQQGGFYPAHPFSPHHAMQRRPAPAGPQLPFLKELSDSVPTENSGTTLPFLGELQQKADGFVHHVPSEHLPFLQELLKKKPKYEEGDAVRHGSNEKYSQSVVHGGLAYISGQVAGDSSADAEGQAVQVLEKLAWRLKEAGSAKKNLLSATVYLSSIKDAKVFNKIWAEWIGDEGAPPARTLVEAKLAQPALKVEVSAIAAV